MSERRSPKGDRLDFLPNPDEQPEEHWSIDRTLGLLVASVKDYAIFLLDTEGRVASWNRGAERIKGYKAPEILGRHFSVFYPEEDIRSGKPQWELVIAADEGRFEDENWRLRKDGTKFWANVVITALRDETGRLRGFGKVTRDDTERKLEQERRDAERAREAEQLREHAKRMGELERTKTEFLNLASHELRGPLTVARGYLSMLEDGSITPTEFLTSAPLIGAKLAQMDLLVRQMLETARIDAHQLDLALTQVDLRQIVEQQVQTVRPLASPTHPLELAMPELPVMVVADPVRIGAVVLNLLDNAIKYSPAGGHVQVLVTGGADRAFVSVRDSGIGIAKPDQERLFTRFGRIDHPDTRSVSGTGLGLYLSREIARRHGGDILLDSTPGVGSRFTLSLQLSTSSPVVN